MATVESLRERLTLLETVVQQHAGRLQSVSDQQTIQMQSHERLHEEIKGLGGRAGSAGGRAGMVDKLLLPERYAGDEVGWRMFSSKLMSCLSKAFPELGPL